MLNLLRSEEGLRAGHKRDRIASNYRNVPIVSLDLFVWHILISAGDKSGMAVGSGVTRVL